MRLDGWRSGSCTEPWGRWSFSRDSGAETWKEPGSPAISWNYRWSLDHSLPDFCSTNDTVSTSLQVLWKEWRVLVNPARTLIKGWSIKSIYKVIRVWNEQRFRTKLLRHLYKTHHLSYRKALKSLSHSVYISFATRILRTSGCIIS